MTVTFDAATEADGSELGASDLSFSTARSAASFTARWSGPVNHPVKPSALRVSEDSNLRSDSNTTSTLSVDVPIFESPTVTPLRPAYPTFVEDLTSVGNAIIPVLNAREGERRGGIFPRNLI